MKIHLHFLIVDDDDGIHDILKGYVRNVLRKPIYNVQSNFHSADSIKRAESVLENNPVQMVFLDIGLPDGDGMDLLENMRSKYPHIKVAIITGHGSKELVVKAVKHKVLGFLTKPFNRAKIEEILKKFYDKLTAD